MRRPINLQAPHAPPSVLTIAGSDSGGGAGIQADLLTFAAHGVHGCSAITAVTAQNTIGVQGIWPVSGKAISEQIKSVLKDLPIKAIKTGMLYSIETVELIINVLSQHQSIPLVVDPVLVATSGDSLAANESLNQHQSYWDLLRRAFLVTPNLHEAAQLLCADVATNEIEMREQANQLLQKGLSAVLLKGGHLVNNNVDILVYQNENTIIEKTFTAKRINSNNIHGTGCTLSAAIAASLAHGYSIENAVSSAKQFISAAIQANADTQLGSGAGPVKHLVGLKNRFPSTNFDTVF